ncbi:hypothetical protein STEG23_025859, partial [Scotinomys teguina]
MTATDIHANAADSERGAMNLTFILLKMNEMRSLKPKTIEWATERAQFSVEQDLNTCKSGFALGVVSRNACVKSPAGSALEQCKTVIQVCSQ